MKPKVIMHTQLSLDGRIRGFDRPDLYYAAAARYTPDTVLFGSNTVNAALADSPPEDEATCVQFTPAPGDTRPLGVAADSRGTCRKLQAIRNISYLRDVVLFVSEASILSVRKLR